MAAALPGSSHRTVAIPGNISVGTSRNLLIAAVTVMECDRRARPGDGVCVRIFVQDPQLEPVGQAIGVGRTRAAPRKVPSPDSIAASHTAEHQVGFVCLAYPCTATAWSIPGRGVPCQVTRWLMLHSTCAARALLRAS